MQKFMLILHVYEFRLKIKEHATFYVFCKVDDVKRDQVIYKLHF